jgi:hypothetical protein
MLPCFMSEHRRTIPLIGGLPVASDPLATAGQKSIPCRGCPGAPGRYSRWAKYPWCQRTRERKYTEMIMRWLHY